MFLTVNDIEAAVITNHRGVLMDLMPNFETVNIAEVTDKYAVTTAANKRSNNNVNGRTTLTFTFEGPSSSTLYLIRNDPTLPAANTFPGVNSTVVSNALNTIATVSGSPVLHFDDGAALGFGMTRLPTNKGLRALSVVWGEDAYAYQWAAMVSEDSYTVARDGRFTWVLSVAFGDPITRARILA